MCRAVFQKLNRGFLILAVGVHHSNGHIRFNRAVLLRENARHELNHLRRGGRSTRNHENIFKCHARLFFRGQFVLDALDVMQKRFVRKVQPASILQGGHDVILHEQVHHARLGVFLHQKPCLFRQKPFGKDFIAYIQQFVEGFGRLHSPFVQIFRQDHHAHRGSIYYPAHQRIVIRADGAQSGIDMLESVLQNRAAG